MAAQQQPSVTATNTSKSDSPPGHPTARQVCELVFVDEGAGNVDSLIASLPHRHDLRDHRSRHVVVLDSKSDGVAQVTAGLLRYRRVDTLHIVSRGSDGVVHLGSAELSPDSLDLYRSAVGAWRHSLQSDADILFHGSCLGATGNGRSLMQQIGLLTGCRVEASELAGTTAREQCPSPFLSSAQHLETEVTFAELVAQGREEEIDRTVVAFVVRRVATGTLKIGTSPSTAAPYAAGTNDRIDARHHAYWEPPATASGTVTGFYVATSDDMEMESIGTIPVRIRVTQISDLSRITPVADQVVPQNGRTGPLLFSVGHVDWTIDVVPLLRRSGGPVTINLTATDRVASSMSAFRVTVTSAAGAVAADSGPADGSLPERPRAIPAVVQPELCPAESDMAPLQSPLQSVMVTLTNPVGPACDESLSVETSDTSLTASWDASTSTLTIRGAGTVAEFLTLIERIRYHSDSERSDIPPRALQFVASDGDRSCQVASANLPVTRDDLEMSSDITWGSAKLSDVDIRAGISCLSETGER